MIYRVHVYSDQDGSEGYMYFATQKEAVWLLRQKVKQGYNKTKIEHCQTPKTKEQILALLKRWAYHPDNG